MDEQDNVVSEKETPPSKKSVPEWLIVLQWGLALIQANLVVAGAFEYRFGYPTGTILYNGALALIVCSYLTFTHTWREAGFRRPQSARSLLWFVLLLLPEVYWQHGPIYASLVQTLPFFRFYLVQILQTQIIFNGLILSNLLKKHPWLAAITVAMIQGITAGLEFLRVLPRDGFVQLLILISAHTAATAFLYAALRIRTGLLWPLILIDLVSSMIYYITLPPNPSPYPLTPHRLAYFISTVLFGLLVGGAALLREQYVRNHPDTSPVAPLFAPPPLMLPEPYEPMTTQIGVAKKSRSAQYTLLGCVGMLVGSCILASLLPLTLLGIGESRPAPQYQQASKEAYFAPVPGAACDHGGAHWVEDPQERYACQQSGLLVTQTYFSYMAEDYFSFADDNDGATARFIPSSYQVQVDTSIISGLPGTCVGLMVHIQEFQGRQTFMACNDATWSIDRCDLRCDKDVVLEYGSLPATTNHLTLLILVSNASMTFIVNGSVVTTIADSTYTTTNQLAIALAGPEDKEVFPSAIFSNFTYTPL